MGHICSLTQPSQKEIVLDDTTTHLSESSPIGFMELLRDMQQRQLTLHQRSQLNLLIQQVGRPLDYLQSEDIPQSTIKLIVNFSRYLYSNKGDYDKWNQSILQCGGQLRRILALKKISLSKDQPRKFERTYDWIRSNVRDCDIFSEEDNDIHDLPIKIK